jgi:hypothetical protein
MCWKSCKGSLLVNLRFPSTQPELVKPLWHVFLVVHWMEHEVVQHLGPVGCFFGLHKTQQGWYHC